MRAEIIEGVLKVFPGSETEKYAMQTWQRVNTHPHDNSAGCHYMPAEVVTLESVEPHTSF